MAMCAAAGERAAVSSSARIVGTIRAAATALLTAGTVLAVAAPALAQQRDAGDEPGAPMSMPAVIVVFVGVPLLIVGIIYVLTYMPLWRQRTGALMRVTTAPTWINGPTSPPAPGGDTVAPGPARGGASATW